MVEVPEKRKQKKEVTREDLKEEGWRFWFHKTDSSLVYGRGDERIVWNQETKEITGRYIHTPVYF